MRLLFVVQRYGAEVAGGAELHCREMAVRMGARGHDVHVLTSRAISYVDWHNEYPPGTEVIDGVTVHRLGVREPRQTRFFGPVGMRTIGGYRPPAPVLQESWMRFQGPDLEGLAPWLSAEAPGFDITIFFTYLYMPTWLGLGVVARRTPTVLHALAHDEAPFWLPIFDAVLTLPSVIAYNSEEERSLITRRARRELPGSVIGVGSDLSPVGDPGRFRKRFGIGERPYLLFVGRVDPEKGSVELHRQFLAFKERHLSGPGSDLALVIVGEKVSALEPHPDVLLTGYVDDQTKVDAMTGCLVLAVPSYFESFSMVLTEAWVQRRPALVQGHSEVLLGHARRSGGAIPYFGFAEFEVALEELLSDPGLASQLGEAGRRYVEENYTWELVLDRYERLLRTAAGSFRARMRRQLT